MGNSGNILIKNPVIFGGGAANLGTKNIDSNGTYNASDDGYDGYSSVEVNVSSSGNTWTTDEDGVLYLSNTQNIHQELIGFSKNINYLEIQDGCTKISDKADFSVCSNLKTMVIPSSIQKIDSTMYVNMLPNLTKIYYKGGISDWCNIQFNSNWNFPSHAMLYTTSDNGETWDAVEHISQNDFSDYLDNGITINNYAFRGYCGLLSIEFNNTAFLDQEKGANIGTEAFNNCEKLSSVDLRTYDTVINSNSFSGCDALETLQICNPAGMYNGFSGCTSLKTVTFTHYGDHSDSLGYNAFSRCVKLTSVDLRDLNITQIPGYCFQKCANLFEIYLPSSLTEIGYQAFEWCSLLTSITIPENVTSIGNYAFRYDYIYEIINLSNLNITAGSSDYGYIAQSAQEIHTDISDKLVVYDQGIVYYNDSSNPIILGIYSYNDQYSYSVPSFLTGCDSYFHMRQTRDMYRVIIEDGATGYYNFSSNPRLKELINESSTATYSVWSGVAEYTDISQSTLRLVSNCICVNNIICGIQPGYKPSQLTITDQSVTSIYSISSPYDETYSYFDVVDFSQTNITTLGASWGNRCYIGIVKLPSTLTTVEPYGTNPTVWRVEFFGTFAQWVGIADTPSVSEYSFSNIPLTQDGFIVESGYYCNGNPLVNIVIPNTVTGIPKYKFAYCKTLQTVTFEANSQCTYIGDSAFSYCINLTSITLPDSLTTINDAAFYSTNLLSIHIPANVSAISYQNVFGNCPLYSVSVDSNNSRYTVPQDSNCIVDNDDPSNPRVIYGGAYCTIPSNYTIGSYACTGRVLSPKMTISLPSTVTYLPAYFFNLVKGLQEIDFTGSTFERTNYQIFYEVKDLRTIILPDTCTNMAYQQFCPYCDNLQKLYLPYNGVVSVSDSALEYVANSAHHLDIYVYPWLLDAYRNDSTWSQYSSYITFKDITSTDLGQVEELIADEDYLVVSESPVIYAHFKNDKLVRVPNQYLTFTPALQDGRFDIAGNYEIVLPGTDISLEVTVSGD